MALTPEQIAEVKKQIFSQTRHLPEERRKDVERQVNSMSPEQLEIFVKEEMSQQSTGGKSIFRMIVDGEIQSVKISENKEAVGVLDINPISKGHVLIIPKNAVSLPTKIPKSAFHLGEEISKKIISNLKAKEVKAHTETRFGESYINLIPIYDKELNINSPKSKANLQELEEVKKQILTEKIEKKPQVFKIKKAGQKGEAVKLKRRVP